MDRKNSYGYHVSWFLIWKIVVKNHWLIWFMNNEGLTSINNNWLVV
jgi:hypothetical protein